MRREPGSRCGGFTLIELMIAAAIVAILAGVAWPSYQEYVRRGNRTEAQSVLMDLAQKEQQYFLDARSYATTLTALNATVPASVSSNYAAPVFTVSAGTPPSFSISMTPSGNQANDSCGTLTIDSAGNKTSSSGSRCW
jgi:type IV pilus assembly protein PilE